jgi:ABC-type transport system involved in multi-copper enzyme maturation permease subunit
MRSALAFERVRVTTVRSTWILIAAGLLLTLLIVLGLTLGTRDDPYDARAQADLLSAVTFLLPVFVAVIGILAFGHEYRHGTIRPALLAVPVRTYLITAKAAVVALLAALVGLGGLVGSWLLALALRGSELTSVGLTAGASERVASGSVLYVVLWSLLGLALGGLIRHVTGAVVLLLVWALVAEPLITGLLTLDFFEPIRPIGSYLPFAAGQRMYAVGGGTTAVVSSEPLSALAGGLVFTAYVAALLTLCWLLFERRDA